MKIMYEKYVIRVRHYTERMKECRSINPDEFPGCQTIIRDKNCTFNGLPHIMTQNKSYLGWVQ